MRTLIGILAVLLISYFVFEKWKKNNPVKWAKMQREVWERQAADFCQEYRSATRRIPDSEWILMTRNEKSDVFLARERLEESFISLPMEARKIAIEKLGITPDFSRRSR